MEKLIQLLNEYEEWKRLNNNHYIKQHYAEHMFKYNSRLGNIIISKKYEFIKWLIDNDKIKWSYKTKKCLVEYDYYEYTPMEKYESMLMYLSIQDNPIEFLSSILK